MAIFQSFMGHRRLLSLLSLPLSLPLLGGFSTDVFARSALPPHCVALASAPLLVAQGQNTAAFGSGGQNGTEGGVGKNGANADNLTIFADGSPLTLNLAGRDGENGQRGSDATAPNCSNQPDKATTNLQAPDGANGGNGGNGGDGGNGGSLTVYATNPAFLSKVFVSAAGGKGGQAGAGGLGSQGCTCNKPYWTVESCSGSPGDSNYRCSTQEFRCTNGRNGVSGNAGLPGREGVVGRLTWINLNKPLESDKPSIALPMTTLKEKGYTLSKNRWETRQGARALLAPGSVIDDEYLALVERVERSFLLIWNAPQNFSEFADRNVTLALNDQQDIQVTMPDDIWLEGTTQKRNEVTEFVVYNAIPAASATRLRDTALTGSGQDLRLYLMDEANQSNLIATKFNLKYSITPSDPRFRPPTDYSTKFSGEVPDSLVARNGDRFVINVGQLPIPPEFLKPGLGVQIELVATRTFSGYQATQKLWITDVITASRSLPSSGSFNPVPPATVPNPTAPVLPTPTLPPANVPFSNTPTVPRPGFPAVPLPNQR